MKNDVKIAVVAGDGIGCEVIPAGVAAIEAAARGSDFTLSFTEFPWGCEHYTKHGRMMEEGGFDRIATFDATITSTVSGWVIILAASAST